MKAPEVEKRSKKERERGAKKETEREREKRRKRQREIVERRKRQREGEGAFAVDTKQREPLGSVAAVGNRVRAGGLKRHKSTKLVESGTSRKWLPFLFIAERNNKRRGQGRPFLNFAELLCRELSHTVIAEHLEER